MSIDRFCVVSYRIVSCQYMNRVNIHQFKSDTNNKRVNIR